MGKNNLRKLLSKINRSFPDEVDFAPISLNLELMQTLQGGLNNGCTNNGCGGTSNNGCTNTSCDYSTNSGCHNNK